MEMNHINWGLETVRDAAAEQYPGCTPARVISQSRDFYRLAAVFGECSAAVSGKFRYQVQTPTDYPGVGDYVAISGGENGTAVIQGLLPRRSLFVRKTAGTAQKPQVVAANMDTLFLCMALNNDFNLRRLERYLSIAWDSGAIPVVVLTKADLCDDLPGKRLAVEAAAPGVDIVVTSALDSRGKEQIAPYLQEGRTVAFIGSSGVGKSTLINAVLGQALLATGGLRNDDKGRHTTTHRQLLPIPGGGLVMDTPGMRELGLWETGEGIERTFSDIEALAAGCKFRDCTHTGEPGCRILAALASGELDEGRWQSYQKLRAENAMAEDVESHLAAKEKKFKQISKINKANRRRS